MNRLGLLAAGCAVSLGASLAATVAPSLAAGSGTCSTTTPSGVSYSVTLCLTAPAANTTISGDVPVTATVTINGGKTGVARVEFGLDGPVSTNPLLTDYSSPYTFVLPSADFPDGVHTFYVDAVLRDRNVTSVLTQSDTFSNNNSNPDVTPLPADTRSPVMATNPPSGAPLVVAAVGDGAGGEANEANVVSLIKSWSPNLFTWLGDVYEDGTYTEFKNWYDPTSYFGAFRSITNPVVGNHEYSDKEGGVKARGYFYYWNNIPNYYSCNAGGWHFIALNSTSQFMGSTGTSPGAKAEYDWLQNDLATNTSPCTVVYYHHPLYTIGQEEASTRLQPWWQLFGQYHVTLVLNGHDHDYERWTPLDGNGSPDPNGVTEFVVGTGGHSSQPPDQTDSRVVYASSGTLYGALRLALSSDHADFQFMQTTGKTTTTLDSGSIPCRGTNGPPPPPTDTTAPTAPTALTATAASPTSVQLSWTASTDDVGVAGYHIYRNGTRLADATTTSYDDTAAAAGTSYSYTVTAYDAAGNESAGSNTATVVTPSAGGTTTTSEGVDVADAYVNAANPSSNYGGSSSLRTDGSPVMISYLRFNVAGTSGGTVTGATLRIYGTSKSAGFTVYPVTDTSWTERGITYNNRPALGEPVATVPANSGAGWVTVDVTPLVHGDGYVDLALVSTSGTQSAYASREASSNPPDLTVTSVS
jgi:chitodextrinase